MLITLSGLNPVTYVKKVIPVLTFAFTSRSSAGTLPLTVQTQNKELGVPEGIFAALIVLSTMNLPVALVGLLISIEPLIDMARTAVNVSGSMTAGLITSKVTKQLDTSVYKNTASTQEAVTPLQNL